MNRRPGVGAMSAVLGPLPLLLIRASGSPSFPPPSGFVDSKPVSVRGRGHGSGASLSQNSPPFIF